MRLFIEFQIPASLIDNETQNNRFLVSGQKFICSEVIAPIRSEADDISLFIINFEDLTDLQTGDAVSEEIEPLKLTKCK